MSTSVKDIHDEEVNMHTKNGAKSSLSRFLLANIGLRAWLALNGPIRAQCVH